MIRAPKPDGAGDIIQQTVAARLHAAVRISDTAARFGGDEFAVPAAGKNRYVLAGR